jgi:hypothetical protein
MKVNFHDNLSPATLGRRDLENADDMPTARQQVQYVSTPKTSTVVGILTSKTVIHSHAANPLSPHKSEEISPRSGGYNYTNCIAASQRSHSFQNRSAAITADSLCLLSLALQRLAKSLRAFSAACLVVTPWVCK